MRTSSLWGCVAAPLSLLLAFGSPTYSFAASTPPFSVRATMDAMNNANAAVVGIKVTAVAGARSAETLGMIRTGSGVVIGADGLVLTIGYLMLEAEQIEIVTQDNKTLPATAVAYDIATGFGLVRLLLPLRGVTPVRDGFVWGRILSRFGDVFGRPVNIAARGFMAKSMLSFDQTVSGTPTTMSNDTSVQGLQLLASPKLIPIIEPYVGVGQLTATGTLSSSAPVPIFSFTNASSASSSFGTTQLLAGLDIHALFFGLGLEWSRAFNTDSYTAKLSVKF